MFIKSKNIAHFKGDNDKVVTAKTPKNFLKEKDGNFSTIQFNFNAKKFVWVQNKKKIKKQKQQFFFNTQLSGFLRQENTQTDVYTDCHKLSCN